MSSILALQIKEAPKLSDLETLDKQVLAEQKGSEGQIFVAFNGFIHDLGDPDGDIELTSEQLARRFQKEGVGMTRGLWGRYNLIVVNIQKQRVYTFQDWLGGPYPLMICGRDHMISISDSLPWMLERYKGWKMDDEAAADFLKEGRIHGPHSLIQGIYKQPPSYRAEIDLKTGAIRFFAAHYRFPKDPVRNFKEYVEVFERSLKSAIAQDDAVGCALSGGYDSNLSLNRLRELRDGTITAFTVGGLVGSDERPAASHIAGQYKDVRTVQGEVGPDTLQEFPRIVYQLEGAVYERGVFLQYVLRRLAEQEKVKSLVLSEGADQVLCPLVRIIRWPKKFRPMRELRPYDMVSLVVMPKNSLMLRDTGITPRYPYLRERYLRITRSLYLKNKMHKYHHRQAVLSALPQGIVADIQKIGGATQAMALFNEDFPFENFKAKALSLRWHDPQVPVLVGGKDQLEGKMDRCLKLMYLYLFEQIYILPQNDQARREAAQKSLKEYLDQIPLKAQIPEMVTRTRSSLLVRVYRRFKRFL